MEISNFMKIRPVKAELIHADGQTERQTDRHDEPDSPLSQFCERAAKCTKYMLTTGHETFLSYLLT